MSDISSLSDEDFLKLIESLPHDNTTLERFQELMNEVKRRSGTGMTKDHYKQLAKAYADSIIKPKR